MEIILASNSPRRKDILNMYGYRFSICSKDTDETFFGDDVESNVKRVALNKAKAVIKENEDKIIIACDTIVSLNGKVYGKPKNECDAYQTLKALSGKTHDVISGVSIIYKDEVTSFSVTSKVTFLDLSDDTIKEYINTKEPFGKAGAYAIQGVGRSLVEKYEGELENIIGLPIKEIAPILDNYIFKEKGFKIREIEIPNKFVLAPMAGITNEAFRVISKEMGAGLVVAEMVSDKALGFKNEKTIKMTKVNPLEHPISMQIFGSDLESMVNAAKWIDVNSDCDIIDINMGCPVNKVAKKALAGSNLLQYPDKVYEITSAVVAAVKKPVSVKIRIGWDQNSINCVEIAKLIEKAGASMIAVHGRTRSQFYSGHADYDSIKAVKDSVKIPVVANGDIVDVKTAMYVLRYTGCDAVMIGRGAQGNPFIFRELVSYYNEKIILPRPQRREIYETIVKHYNLLKNLKGEHLAILEMRGHISQYIKGLPQSSGIKNLVNQSKSEEEIFTLLKDYLI